MCTLEQQRYMLFLRNENVKRYKESKGTDMRIEDCRLFQFNDLGDERGKLVVIEGEKDIPFRIERVFYIYGSDASVIRGQHANKTTDFLLINVSGSSKVRVADGRQEKIYILDKPMEGILVPHMVWKDMYDFSKDSVLLVLANTHYDAEEYIRDYDEYMKEVLKE